MHMCIAKYEGDRNFSVLFHHSNKVKGDIVHNHEAAQDLEQKSSGKTNLF